MVSTRPRWNKRVCTHQTSLGRRNAVETGEVDWLIFIPLICSVFQGRVLLEGQKVEVTIEVKRTVFVMYIAKLLSAGDQALVIVCPASTMS